MRKNNNEKSILDLNDLEEVVNHNVEYNYYS